MKKFALSLQPPPVHQGVRRRSWSPTLSVMASLIQTVRWRIERLFDTFGLGRGRGEQGPVDAAARH
jgi:hypothetical protein